MLPLLTVGQAPKEEPCRDRFLEPFSSDSIWNTAIGSKAIFAATKLFSSPDLYPTQFHNDQDFFLQTFSTDPLIDWVDQGDWGSDDHCQVTGEVVTQIHFPANFTSASDCDAPNVNCRSKPNQVFL